MNRRTAMGTIVGALGVAGVEAKAVAEVPPGCRFFIIECEKRLKDYSKEAIQRCLKTKFEGTPYEGSIVIVLDGGAKFKSVDANGVVHG